MDTIDVLKLYKKDIEKIIAREEKKLQKENEKNKAEYDVVVSEYDSENEVMEMFGYEAITEKEKNRLIYMLNTGGPNAPTSNLYLDILKRDLKSINLEIKYPADSDYIESVSDPRVVELEKKIEEMKKEFEEQKVMLNLQVSQLADRNLKFIEENKQLKVSIIGFQKLNDEKKHNNRGAGRKSKFTDEEKAMIKMYRFQGKTIKEISEMYNCSVGLIHKLINE